MANDLSPTQIVPVADKRDLEAPAEESGTPQKAPKISSICLGIGSADKIGELNARDYDEDLKAMAEEYDAAIKSGGCFVHVRAKQSSNTDLRNPEPINQGRQVQ